MMPFGLSGAPATFQRLMDRVLRGLDSFSAAYLDDVIIFSTSWESHLEHLRAVFQRLREAGLKAKPHKCQFGMQQCSYLGHVVVVEWRSQNSQNCKLWRHSRSHKPRSKYTRSWARRDTTASSSLTSQR